MENNHSFITHDLFVTRVDWLLEVMGTMKFGNAGVVTQGMYMLVSPDGILYVDFPRVNLPIVALEVESVAGSI